MQREIAADTTAPAIQILGVNGVGQEAGNAETCLNRTTPWLQDTATDLVWEKWAVTYRDVVVLDRENRRVAVYNLTVHNLGIPENYNSLKALLIGAAAP